MNLRSHATSLTTGLIRLRQGRASRRVASGTALTLVAGVLVVLAVNADGLPISKVDLNDGSVWVTKDGAGIIGRLNSQVKELDLGVLTRSAGTELHQEAADVQVVDLGGGANKRVMVVDVAGGTAGKALELPKTVTVSAGRRTVAIVDTQSGLGWVKASTSMSGFTVKDPAVVKGLGPKSVVSVGADGTAYFLDRAHGAVVPVSLDANGAAVKGAAIDLDAEIGDDAMMTIVGDRPVVLDRGSATVHRAGGGALEVEGGAEAQLQQPQGTEDGQPSDFFVATPTALYRAGLDGGDLEKVSTVTVQGAPAAPVVVAGCTYAAWLDPAAPASFEQVCGTKASSQKIPQLSDQAELVFRVNRDVVVLNDAAGGTSWMVQAGMEIVDNWEMIDPREKQDKEEVEEQKQRDPNKNEPPTAKADKDFGARPGTTVVLPVTVNDTDPDGDILTISPTLQTDAQGVQLSVVGNGTQVQARIGPEVRGDVEFTYAVTDGQPDHPESEAPVTLAVVGSEKDSKPKKFEERTNELEVARGFEARTNVLPAWFDPDGDTVVLTAASSKGGDVRFRPDGTITFVDDGAGGAAKTIDFTLRGGGESITSKVDVTVLDPGKAAPTTVPDRVTGIAGSTILLDPLTNDSDPLGGTMTLTSLSAQAASSGDVEYAFDATKGTGTVRAPKAGSYYLEYVATNTAASSEPQVIRVDAIAVGRINHPPVAEKDTATLVGGGSALVDVLANDSDPDGDVLVVRGFGQVPDGIKASLVDKQFVRVESVAPLEAQQEITYHLSDGENQVDGSITVTASEGDRNRPPVALADQFPARAGTIITVPVLANDVDPDGDKLSVYGQDLTDLPADVPVIATGSAVRIMVPDDGRTEIDFGYTTHDPDQAGATARVVLNISPDDAKGNQAPRPGPIEDRAIGGKKVRVPISAYNSDPDGDPVSFSAIAQQPELGRIVRTGVDWVEYEPDEDSVGTDSFMVEVSDQYGASGRVEVRVGVAPREPVNQPPTALDDEVTVRPGRTIQYPVRDNDTDPDGDGFSLLPDVNSSAGGDAKIAGDFVQLTSPSLDGQSERIATAQYAVTDRLGGQSRATLSVTSSDRAPLHAPIANDDTVALSKIAGKKPGDTVDVAVLSNDGDIDGSKAALTFEPLAGGTVLGRTMQVTLSDKDQVVAYRLVDSDDQASFGFVYVAGTDSVAPVLDQSKVPVRVTAGEVKQISLRDIINVRDGHEPRIARRDQVLVVNGDGKTESSTDDQTLSFRSLKQYHGPASMLLEVTDGADLNDPEGLVSQITVPIDVKPLGNVAPVVRSTSVTVAGGGEPAEIDLTRLAEDANDDDLTFEVKDGTKGVAGQVDGDVLKVSATKDATVGDTVELTVLVSDGKVANPSTGTVQVRVVDSTKPLMTLVSPISLEGTAGEPSEVDVLDQIVTDPFPDDKKSLSSPTVLSGRGTVAARGTTLVVTPAKGFDGVVAAGFRMDDGSGLASRSISGRVEVTVSDKPDAPGRPTADPSGPDAVRVSWSAPDDNGKQITEYRVTWNGGTRSCTGTQCVIDGLDPGTEYVFTVAASNEKGWSKESSKSSPVTPDDAPDQMVAPTIDPTTTFPARDRKLAVTWVVPQNAGSAITGYEVQQSPGDVTTFGGGVLTSSFGSLQNGTAYKFRARAVNAKGESPWSNWSETAVPFTKPGPVAPFEITADPPDGNGSGHVNVAWNAPADVGGDPDRIQIYQVEVLGDGVVAASKQTADLATDFTVANGKQYTARIKAVNKAGVADEWVTSSNTVTVYDLAKAPTNLQQSGEDGDKSGKLSFTTPSDSGGFPVTKYLVQTQDGNSFTAPAKSSGEGVSATIDVTFNGNHNDGQWVRITPVTEPTGQGDKQGASAQSGSVFRPFGDPGAPGSNGSSQGYRSTTISWTGGTPNGRPIEKTEFKGDATGDAGGNGGSTTIATNQGGEQRCVQARAMAGGRWSSWSGNLCGTAQARTVSVSKGPAQSISGCSNNCYFVDINVAGFVSNSGQSADISMNGNSNWCEGASGCVDPKGFTVNGDGRGLLRYYVNGTPGTVSVNVGGITGSIQW
ncbi:Ig-like domain-containing protein [Aeromicrobium fastidiosum]|uniref:Tandem-95 repeat protein n=1 Tax=Aeromicrobium fastidiosum TaxID=52699 RepID=A0A641AL41_9ACTN|nr:Ig-like domain-containing protein [Aeromicrobium fastidiosum]KAA1374686.1 tandem-95 repeat protein [Aeromicrobium fastidiosum]MBP2390767.1 hypothetical protein [Aeromicrobium fastidiosum]